MNDTVLGQIESLISQLAIDFKNQRKAADKTKYFCIGRNKTASISLKGAFDGFDDSCKAEILNGKHSLYAEFLPPPSLLTDQYSPFLSRQTGSLA